MSVKGQREDVPIRDHVRLSSGAMKLFYIQIVEGAKEMYAYININIGKQKEVS